MKEGGECVQNGPKYEVPTRVCSSYGTPYGCNTSGGPFYNAILVLKNGHAFEKVRYEEPSIEGKKSHEYTKMSNSR